MTDNLAGRPACRSLGVGRASSGDLGGLKRYSVKTFLVIRVQRPLKVSAILKVSKIGFFKDRF
jgi:hypothetical protein